MKNNLFADIVTSRSRYSCNQTEFLESINAVYENHVDSRQSALGVAEDNGNRKQSLPNAASSHYSILIDSVQKFNDETHSLLLSSSGYIGYGITIVRDADSVNHTVWKRFREIAAFHTEVIQNFVFSFSNHEIEDSVFLHRF